MKKLLFISILFFGCNKKQPDNFGHLPTIDNIGNPGGDPDGTIYNLIIFGGDSNSGGYGDNLQAAPTEIGVRPNVIILNNSTLIFEPLNIGVNNLIGGNTNATMFTRHGWELMLANSADSGSLQTPTFLVKTGQAGGRIVTLSSGAYWNLFTARVDKAKSLLTSINGGIPPKIFMFYSEGINDHNDGIPVATWKQNTKQYFTNIRNRYGTVPVFMTYVPTAVNDPYQTAITQMKTEVTDFHSVSITGATRVSIHWNYAGLKTLASRMIWTMKGNYTFY